MKPQAGHVGPLEEEKELGRSETDPLVPQKRWGRYVDRTEGEGDCFLSDWEIFDRRLTIAPMVWSGRPAVRRRLESMGDFGLRMVKGMGEWISRWLSLYEFLVCVFFPCSASPLPHPAFLHVSHYLSPVDGYLSLSSQSKLGCRHVKESSRATSRFEKAEMGKWERNTLLRVRGMT